MRNERRQGEPNVTEARGGSQERKGKMRAPFLVRRGGACTLFACQVGERPHWILNIGCSRSIDLRWGLAPVPKHHTRRAK